MVACVNSAPPRYSPDGLRPTQCRQPLRLRGLQADRTTGEITPVTEIAARCRSWTDPGCGLRLRGLHVDLVKAGIAHHAERGRFARFLTITFPADDGAQVDVARDVARCSAIVARFIQEIRRTHTPRIEYYAAKEATKRGRLHVHLVTTGPYLRKCSHRGQAGGCHGPNGCITNHRRPCIQATAHRLGLGWVDVRRITGAGEAAAYVAKYLGKQVGQQWPHYSRRSTYSMGRLVCDTHPDQAGRRCCPDAHRITGYAPTLTIGALWAQANRRALISGYLAGHITLDDLDDHEAVDLWEYAGRAEPPRAPPNIELPEAHVIARYNAITRGLLVAAGIDPDAWQDADRRRHFLAHHSPAPVPAGA